MNYKIDITSKAQNDLEEIFRYIAFDLQSFINASNLLDRLEQAIYSLEQMPERFRLYDKGPWKSKNLRIMPIDNYLVLYITNNVKHIVTIVRVMYGGRHIEKQINK